MDNIPNQPPNPGNSVFVRVPFGKITYPSVTPGVTWTLDHSDKRLAGQAIDSCLTAESRRKKKTD